MGQPTHVLVDTLQHPAVELTQAEGAAVDSSDVSDTSSASSSSSNSLDLVNEYLTDDWMIIVTGVIGGCVGCVLLLAIVSLTMRRCYKSRNSSRNHKHNRARDSNGLNNSDSSSEKGCYGDPTITSDNMILMSNGEIDTGENMIRQTNYNQEHDMSHLSHPHLHQCIQQPHQGNFDHPNQGVSGFQHVTVGASTMRKGILKHHQSSTVPSGMSENLCMQHPKPDVTMSGNREGDGSLSAMPLLPPKIKQGIVATMTSSVIDQGCQEHTSDFGMFLI
jgi:hypothetical protein